MLRKPSPITVASALCIACLAGGPVHAGEKNHDAVRQAVERGEIQSLTCILAKVRDKLPGDVVTIEAEKKKDRWVYEFRVVDAKGRLLEVYVDARTGEIVRTKEK